MQYLKSDIVGKSIYMYGKTGFKAILAVMFSDGTSAMILFRFSSFLQRCGLGVLGSLVSRFNCLINSIVIGQGASIDAGFIIMHTVGVVINGKVKIGKNAVIQSGVVIGAVNRVSPIIGNNVAIGAGAKILGGVVIGDNVKIGANAVVVSDIPDNATAVGVPARVISRH